MCCTFAQGNGSHRKIFYMATRQLTDNPSYPVLLGQCIDAYNAFNDEARQVKRPDLGGEVLLWTGFAVGYLEDTVDISRNVYSRVMNALYEMGCVHQVQKGTGVVQPTELVLVGPPTVEVFEYFKERANINRMYGLKIQDRRLNNLENRVKELENEVRRLQNED